MKKIFVFAGSLLLCGGLHAQNKRSLVDIDKELKQAKSTATAEALIESIADATPQTDEDVSVLGRLMDKYPAQGQKALRRLKDPRLGGAILKECDRQATKIKKVRAKANIALTAEDRQDYLSGYMSITALVGALVNLKDANAIPMLREYLKDEDLSSVASVALGRLGDNESMEVMLKRMGAGTPIDLAGYGDKGLVRVVEELDKPGVDLKRKNALVEQIKGSASPARKRILKDLALKHSDPRVRDRSALALLNSIMVNQEPGDQLFVSEWIKKTKNDETGDWAVISIRVSHGNGTKPLSPAMEALLVELLQTSSRETIRNEAAQDLGMFNVKGALPYLKDCLIQDTESSVRTECRYAYWKITGNVPAEFHPADAKRQAGYYKRPDVVETFSRKSDLNPDDRYSLALKRAFEEYNSKSGK